jgi:hypothetical protein
MVELLFMVQLVRNPLQAIARRWWCMSLSRLARPAPLRRMHQIVTPA